MVRKAKGAARIADCSDGVKRAAARIATIALEKLKGVRIRAGVEIHGFSAVHIGVCDALVRRGGNGVNPVGRAAEAIINADKSLDTEEEGAKC